MILKLAAVSIAHFKIAAMSIPNPIPARLHLLRAHSVPVIVVIRRGPSKLFHVIKWNTEGDKLEYGSWFKGRLYSENCDVSFDGQWMVYQALGARAEWWSGCCRLPFLKTYLDSDTALGGGYWANAQTLMLRGWVNTRGQVPFETRELEGESWRLKDLNSLKMERDGWKRNDSKRGARQEIKSGSNSRITSNQDWSWQFEGEGPTLLCFDRGAPNNDLGFKFRVLEHSQLLDDSVQWATFDARGHLVVARAGWIERYAPESIQSATPDFRLDLNGLTRPPREQ